VQHVLQEDVFYHALMDEQDVRVFDVDMFGVVYFAASAVE
jgi:hypothetical protein